MGNYIVKCYIGFCTPSRTEMETKKKFDLLGFGNDRAPHCKNHFALVITVEYSSVLFLKWRDGV